MTDRPAREWCLPRRLHVLAAFVLMVLGAVHGAQAGTPSGARIYISVDMEGVAGVVSLNQTRPTGSEYAQARKWMTAEVLAAIEGARAAGATEFVVSDSHGNFENLLLDELPADVRVIRGTPRPLGGMQGIADGRFDAVMFIGYHASANSADGLLAHTMSGGRFNEIRLNGEPVSEVALGAALAARYGVPVALVSGDDACLDELRASHREAELVSVKRAVGFTAANLVSLATGRQMIRDASERAVRNLSRLAKPSRLRKADLEISFKDIRHAEMLSWLPGVERLGSRSIRYRADDITTAVRVLSFISAYGANL